MHLTIEYVFRLLSGIVNTGLKITTFLMIVSLVLKIKEEVLIVYLSQTIQNIIFKNKSLYVAFIDYERRSIVSFTILCSETAWLKGPRCFLEQETLPLLLSTGWFQELIRA